jgi:hypothetical protein
LTGGDGIDPSSISNGNTISVAWGDASDLGSSGGISSNTVGTTELDIQSGLSMNNNKITDLAAPTNANDAVRQTDLSDYVQKSGDTMTGDLDFNSKNIEDGGTNAIEFDGSANINLPNKLYMGDSEFVDSNRDVKARDVTVGGQLSVSNSFQLPVGTDAY